MWIKNVSTGHFQFLPEQTWGSGVRSSKDLKPLQFISLPFTHVHGNCLCSAASHSGCLSDTILHFEVNFLSGVETMLDVRKDLENIPLAGALL